MHARTAVRLLLVAAVVLATVPSAAAARSVPSDEPLLTDYQKTDEVVANGSSYTIYRYDSPLPYVDGLTVYRNGTSVDETTATSVLRVYAQQVAIANLERAELDTIRNIRNDSQRVQAIAGPTVEALNDTLAYTERLQNETVDGQSAWKAAVAEVPTLEDRFGEGLGGGASDVAELRTKLLRWERTAANVEENATAVVTMVQSRRNGTDIDKNRLYRRYDAMLSSLERLRALTEDVNNRVPDAAKATATIADRSGAVAQVGTELERRFGALTDRLRKTAKSASDIDEGISDRRKSLRQIHQRATSIRQQMREQWAATGAIQSTVYGTFGEGSLVVIAGLFAAYRTRSGG